MEILTNRPINPTLCMLCPLSTMASLSSSSSYTFLSFPPRLPSSLQHFHTPPVLFSTHRPIPSCKLSSLSSNTSLVTLLSTTRRNQSLDYSNGRTRVRARARTLKVRSQVTQPVISPHDHWGIWTALFATGAFGLWSEKTKIGSMVSAALVSTLVGLAASSVGIIPCEAPAYTIVLEFLLPLTIPLLLFRANLRRVIQSTGKLLLAFLLGSVATVVGTLIAFLLVPMRSLGQDNWKIAAALMGSYIGGSVNYVAVSEALGMSPSVLAAGVAADNVICAIYFMILFGLASKVPAEPPTSTADVPLDLASDSGGGLPVLQTIMALAMSFAICRAATYLTKLYGIQGGTLPVITAVVVILATVLPQQFGYLAEAGDAISLVLMQVFFAVVGASGSIWNVLVTAPSIFMFAIVQVSIHLAMIIGLGKLFNFDLKLLLLASNANVGGPTTACGMATAKGWSSLAVPGILAGIFGVSIATFLGVGLGLTVLRYM